MEKFTIGRIPSLSGSAVATSSVNNPFNKINGGYYVYSNIGAGDITNEYTINNFLDDKLNSNVTDRFISYLSANTSTVELREFLTNNTKLSSIFNKFYNFHIRSGLPLGPTLIDMEFSGDTLISYDMNVFNDKGEREISKRSDYTLINTGDSYYVTFQMNATVMPLETKQTKYSKDCIGGNVLRKKVTHSQYLLIDKIVAFPSIAEFEKAKSENPDIKKGGLAFSGGNPIITATTKTPRQFREVSFDTVPVVLSQCFVDTSINDNAFDFWHTGLDSDIATIDGQDAPEITSFIKGNVSETEFLIPEGVTTVVYGDDLKFEFFTESLEKIVKAVRVGGEVVDYIPLARKAKKFGGLYTVRNITGNTEFTVEFSNKDGTPLPPKIIEPVIITPPTRTIPAIGGTTPTIIEPDVGFDPDTLDDRTKPV